MSHTASCAGCQGRRVISPESRLLHGETPKWYLSSWFGGNEIERACDVFVFGRLDCVGFASKHKVLILLKSLALASFSPVGKWLNRSDLLVLHKQRVWLGVRSVRHRHPSASSSSGSILCRGWEAAFRPGSCPCVSALSGCEALTHRRQTWAQNRNHGQPPADEGGAVSREQRGDCGLGALVWEGAVGPELEQRGAGLPPPWPRSLVHYPEAGVGCGGRKALCYPPASPLRPVALPRSKGPARPWPPPLTLCPS